jgi:RHS repeat-associated protein
MFDEKGVQTWSAELDIYGIVNNLQGDRSDCPFRYPGQYEDGEIGLYYNRFRYYDPAGGEYVSQDPTGLAGGMNIHTYVNSPNNSYDPLGLFNKPISWPSARKVGIDMVEVITGHTATGGRAVQSGIKDLFPKDWSSDKIEKAIREAYTNTFERLKVQRNPLGEIRHKIRGNGKGLIIEMWYNATTQQIETAYPKGHTGCGH